MSGRLLQFAPLEGLWARLQTMSTGAREFALALAAALLVLIVGWLLAVLIGWLASALLRATGFNHGARNLFAGGPLGDHEPAGVVGTIVRWSVIAIAVVLAVDVLGYDLSGALLYRLTEVIPRVLAAVLLLIGGSLVAMLLGALTRRFFDRAGVSGARLRGQVVTGIFTFFAVVVALEQLGFAAQFVLALGLIVTGTAGLAVALAVGLGCRDLARDFVVEYLKTLGDRDDRP